MSTVKGFKYSLKFTLILILIITQLNKNDGNREELLSFLENLDITSTARYNPDTEANNDITDALNSVMTHYSNNNIIKMASNLLGLFNQLNNSYDNPSRCYKLSIEDDYENIIKLIKAYRELIKVSASFLGFHFHPRMSSGGKELLFFFSKLNDELREFQKREKYQVINLILDEPNVFSHPDWQKKFLNMLLEFLNENYSSFKFNIVIATHSPFILSDIPKSNNIFLDSYVEEDDDVKNKTQKIGNCKVVKGIKKQTFGANIYTLLRDGFFMSEGLMGDFSKKKIEKVIKLLRSKSKKVSFDEAEKIISLKEAEKIINVLGEPILKRRLESMLDEFKLDFKKKTDIDLKKEIDKHEKQIRKLKKQINKND